MSLFSVWFLSMCSYIFDGCLEVLKLFAEIYAGNYKPLYAHSL